MPEEKKPNYPGNSHRTKVAVEKKVEVTTETEPERKPKHEPVVKGSVTKKQKKVTLGQKIAATFTGDDAKSLGEYLLLDVAIPALKALIVEATEQGIHRLMFGEVRPRSSSGRSHVSYNRMAGNSSYSTTYRSNDRQREEPRSMSRTAKATHNFDEILFGDIRDAEAVIHQLDNIQDQYGVVTVSDLYDLVDITSEYTDEKWGWNGLAGVTTRRVPGGGYILDMPNPEYLV